MNCSEVQALLSAYHDGELADDERDRLSCHLDQCSRCAEELGAFQKLSQMASGLGTLVPPGSIWTRLAQQLDEGCGERPVAPLRLRRWITPVPRLLAIAASTVAIAVGIGWFAVDSQHRRVAQSSFTAEFGRYLDEFRRDPDAAHQILLAKYDHQLVDPDRATDRIGFRPVVADGLPNGYTLVSTHVVQMPCCVCIQSMCKRRDGSSLVVFEHDEHESAEWFGDRPDITARCNDKQCCLIQLDEQLAASWEQGTRHITLIGVRDVAEVSQMVAWLDPQVDRK